MDIFITSMLHLGLTGLTVGTPFISYRGPGKTKSFLRSIGGDWAIVEDDIVFDQLKERFFLPKVMLYGKYDSKILSTMIEQSKQQYSFCRMIVEKYA